MSEFLSDIEMSRIFVSVCSHMSRIFVSVCSHMSRNFVSVCSHMSRNFLSVCPVFHIFYILINYCPSSRLRILMSMIPLLTSVLFIFFNLRIPLSMIHFYLSVLFIFWSENHIVNDLPTYVRPVYKNPPSPPCPITFGKSARTSRRPACWPLHKFIY